MHDLKYEIESETEEDETEKTVEEIKIFKLSA